MKRNLTMLAILSLCTLSSCTEWEKVKVYRLKPLKGLKTIEAIKDEGLNKEIKAGDTVYVNIDDSVIEGVKTERPYFINAGIEYNYIVESSFESYKD